MTSDLGGIGELPTEYLHSQQWEYEYEEKQDHEQRVYRWYGIHQRFHQVSHVLPVSVVCKLYKVIIIKPAPPFTKFCQQKLQAMDARNALALSLCTVDVSQFGKVIVGGGKEKSCLGYFVMVLKVCFSFLMSWWIKVTRSINQPFNQWQTKICKFSWWVFFRVTTDSLKTDGHIFGTSVWLGWYLEWDTVSGNTTPRAKSNFHNHQKYPQQCVLFLLPLILIGCRPIFSSLATKCLFVLDFPQQSYKLLLIEFDNCGGCSYPLLLFTSTIGCGAEK